MKQFGLFLFFAVWTFRLQAQGTPYHYSVPAAVASELIYCIEQDAHGRLLIATDKGMYRYNGFKSTRIPMVGNYSREISLITCAGNRIFAANRAGQLLELKDDKLLTIDLKDFSGDIRQIQVEGQVLIITGSKFITRYSLPDFKFIEQESIPFTEVLGVNANSVVTFRNKRYAVLNSDELVEIDEGAARNIPSSTGKFIVEFNNQLVILPNYVANEPVTTFLNGRFRFWGTMLPRSTSRVMNVRVINNQLFVLTENGIFVYPSAMTKKPAHWFAGISVTDIFRDRQGNSWIGTRGKGVLFVPAGRHDVIFSGSLLSIEAGPDNTFFGGKLDGTIARFDLRGKELQAFNSELGSQDALFLHYDSYARLLFSNTGIFSIFPKARPVTSGEFFKSIARAKDGGLYLSRSSGIIYIPPGKKNQLAALSDTTKFTFLRREPGRSVVLNADQTVALSTVRGVFWKKPGGELREISYMGQPIDAQAMTWFHNDLIIATTSNELLLAHEGKITRKADLSGSVGDLIILKMLATGSHVYILTEKGMYRFTGINDKIESLKELAGFDGLLIRDFTIVKDFLYIATQRGVLRFKWQLESTVSFTLVLNELYGQKYKRITPKNGKLIFPQDEQAIIIPFECVDLSGNQHFIIQYAIRSGNEKRVWNSLPSSVDQLSLSHLSPGNYCIEFRVVDPVSRTASPIQEKRFMLMGKWYDRPVLWWFIGISLAFLTGWLWRWSLIRQRKNFLKRVRVSRK